MLFKPEDDKPKIATKRVARGIGRRFVSLTITLLILGGLFYLGWNAFQQKQGAGRGGPGARLDLPVPVLAATPRIQDMPVYLDAVGSVRAPATRATAASSSPSVRAITPTDEPSSTSMSAATS